jgi:murein DD-endopeptidase MepM/ murein hydrolase activator NlpD
LGDEVRAVIRSRNALLATLLALVAAGSLVVPAGAAGTGRAWIWPTTGRVTQPYGCTGFISEPRLGSCAHFHGGIDIANTRGTLIRAAADGVITHVGWDQWGTGAWMVIINHGGGLTTWYAHMRGKQIPGIRVGVRVIQGEVIGYMDTTGNSTGVHLHFSVLKDGHYVNPRDYIDGLPLKPPKKGDHTSPAPCDDIWIAGLSGGATAVVLEGDDGNGGSGTTCVA